MWLLLTGILIVAAPFALGVYFRHAAARLRSAPEAWDATEKHARVLLEDRHLNPKVGDFVEFTLQQAGNGSMTRTFLRALLLPWSFSNGSDKDAAALLGSMNREQAQQFYRFMATAMLYDSFRTWVSGTFLRRVLYWIVAAATDKDVPVTRAQVEPMVSATERLCHAEAA